MGIEKKDEVEEKMLEQAEAGELVDAPDGSKLPKAGKGISGMRPKPYSSREVFSLEEAIEAGLKGLEEAVEEDDFEDDQPTRPDGPSALSGIFIENISRSSIQRRPSLSEVSDDLFSSAPKVVVPPLGDVSKFAPELEEENNAFRNLLTIPDISAIRFRSRDEIARMQGLIDEHLLERSKYTRPDGTIYVPDAELRKNREAGIKPDPGEKLLTLMQHNHGYQVAWWKSNNALIRLWGQLDCAAQIFEDEAILLDLKEVLGDGFMVEDERGVKITGIFEMGFVRTHQPQIKFQIRKKYPQVNLDAIIAKQKNK